MRLTTHGTAVDNYVLLLMLSDDAGTVQPDDGRVPGLGGTGWIRIRVVIGHLILDLPGRGQQVRSCVSPVPVDRVSADNRSHLDVGDPGPAAFRTTIMFATFRNVVTMRAAS